jgi:hypothetical protein
MRRQESNLLTCGGENGPRTTSGDGAGWTTFNGGGGSFRRRSGSKVRSAGWRRLGFGSNPHGVGLYLYGVLDRIVDGKNHNFPSLNRTLSRNDSGVIKKGVISVSSQPSQTLTPGRVNEGVTPHVFNLQDYVIHMFKRAKSSMKFKSRIRIQSL